MSIGDRFVYNEAYNAVLAAMEAGAELSVVDIAEQFGKHRTIAYKYVWHMKKNGDIYIRRWEQNATGPLYPIYAYGNKPDARKPKLRSEVNTEPRKRNTQQPAPRMLWGVPI